MPDYFSDVYLPNIRGATITYKKWRSSYAAEAAKWDSYLVKVLAFEKGKPRPAAPVLGSRFGKQLVAAAELHVSVTDIGAVIPQPPPPVTPTLSTNISNGQVLTMPFTWTATSTVPPESIEFWVDNALVSADDTSPYSYTLNLAAGEHVLGLCGWHAGIKTCMNPAAGEIGFARITVPQSPSGTHVRSFDRLTSACFSGIRNKYQPAGSWWAPADTSGTAWSNGGGVFEISTPYGNGLKFKANSDMRTQWAPTVSKIAAGDWLNISPSFLGRTLRWDGYVYLPSSGNTSGYAHPSWQGNVLWQPGETTGNSVHGDTVGHQLLLYSDRRLVFNIRATNVHWGDVQVYSSPLTEDAWHHVVWEIKHSFSSDGYHKAWVDEVQLVDRTGATMFGGENIWACSFGWYSPYPNDNEVWYGNLTLTEV